MKKLGKAARGRKEKEAVVEQEEAFVSISYGIPEISLPKVCLVEVDVYTPSLRFFFAHGTS